MISKAATGSQNKTWISQDRELGQRLEACAVWLFKGHELLSKFTAAGEWFSGEDGMVSKYLEVWRTT